MEDVEELREDQEYQEALRDFLEGSDEDTEMPQESESLDLPVPDLVDSDSSYSSLDPDDPAFMPSNRK